ncbi:hypothetical protein BH18THE2_BH18THE2_09230 [soil metagenome]
MTKKLDRRQRETLRQLILDCTLRRLSTYEALEYIRHKMKVSITERYYFVVKKNIIDSAGEQITYLQKNRNAYLANIFERIAEQHKITKELWEMYYSAKDEKERNVQLSCIRELKDISVNLLNIHTIIPGIAGLQFEQTVEAIGIGEEHTSGKHIDGYSKDCKVCEDEEAKF